MSTNKINLSGDNSPEDNDDKLDMEDMIDVIQCLGEIDGVTVIEANLKKDKENNTNIMNISLSLGGVSKQNLEDSEHSIDEQK